MIHRTRSGFTLIELLVVIAIIAIPPRRFSSPFLLRHAPKPDRPVGLSNAKQLSLAAQMYTQDYDEHYMEVYRMHEGVDWTVWPAGEYAKPDGKPYGWYTGPTEGVRTYPGITQNWASILQPYIKSAGLFSNPSGTSTAWRPATSTDNMGYIYSNWIADGGVYNGPALKLAALRRPAETVVLWETGKSQLACRDARMERH